MSNPITISTTPPAGWNDFVERRQSPPIEQFSWWAETEATDGWNALYAVQREGDEILAGVMILTRRMKKAGLVGYVFRGPLLEKSASETGTAPARSCNLLVAASRQAGLRFLVVAPPYDGAPFSQHALRAGFLRHPSFLPPSGLPQATIAVDLKKSPDLVEKSFRRSTRQEIIIGRRTGVVVEKGGAADLDEFWQLHAALCQRRGVTSNIPSLAYVQKLWSAFAGHGRGWIFKVRHGDEPLGSLICLRAGDICYAWRIGWNGAQAEKYPTKVLYAEAMRHVAEAGCTRFDFMQIDPAVVAALQRGEKPTGRDAGLSVFKLGFSGTVAEIPPTLIWFPNPIFRLIFRWVAFPMMRNSHIRRFLLRR